MDGGSARRRDVSTRGAAEALRAARRLVATFGLPAAVLPGTRRVDAALRPTRFFAGARFVRDFFAATLRAGRRFVAVVVAARFVECVRLRVAMIEPPRNRPRCAGWRVLRRM